MRRGGEAAASAAAAGVFLLTLALLLLLYSPQRPLYDTDSYYHLAVARLFAQEGLPRELAWARFSALGEGFGDKELLFHYLLAPFAAGDDAEGGGRLALALLGASVLAAVAALAWRAVGPWGLAAPLALLLGAHQLTWRLVRLRPELLALLLLLLAVWAIARERYRLTGALAALFTLSYTAFHAFLGLCWLHWLFCGLRHRRWHWPLLAYPLLGVGVGLLLHPHFPHNLVIWKLQTFDYLRAARHLDVGSEILPATTEVALFANLGWWLVMAVLLRATVPRAEVAPASPEDERFADAFGVAAVVFGLLWLLMSRFALYFFPFATLWALFELRRRRREVAPRLALPQGRSVPTWAALALAMLLAAPVATQEVRRFRQRTDPGAYGERLRDRQALAAALPPGARVVAPWGATALYVFWAPHGRYLNVLDPVFMASVYPAAYEAERRLFGGRDPDSPLTAATTFDSNFIAYSLARDETRGLTARLQADPRVVARHRGIHGVFEVVADGNHDFLLDWRVLPWGTPWPPAPSLPLAELPGYPRHPSERGRKVEGFVDARRVLGDRAGCLAVVTEWRPSGPGRAWLELAPWGPSELWLDGALLVQVAGTDAVLGRGARLPVAPGPQARRLAVHTCRSPGAAAGDPVGFYLLERAAG
jgi:hypothetical protein